MFPLLSWPLPTMYPLVYLAKVFCLKTPGVSTSCATLGATRKNKMSSKSQGQVAYFSKKKHNSESTKKLLCLMLRSKDIVPSIVPPPSCHPTGLLCIPPPIAPPALPIAAWAALRVSYSQRAAPRV